MMNRVFILPLLLLFLSLACSSRGSEQEASRATQLKGVDQAQIIPGADRMDVYLPMLAGKKVGIMANQTSIIGPEKAHLVDKLLDNQVDLKFVFAPEHGFRGNIERGEAVNDQVDAKTGLPIYSLYGPNDEAAQIVQSVDVMIFDLQDVGARFYTYITSMHRLMQLCLDQNKKLIVLDRPNPNGDQIDGPVRKSDKFKSTVSFHKIAMIHGLTVGELAQMINGEAWLDGGVCDLEVVPVQNYSHDMTYELPVIPSPSLPNQLSVRLYMSLCLFEGTDISVGRGTDWPFQVIGYSNPIYGDFTFVPEEKSGMSVHVEGKHKTNYGIDLRELIPADQRFTLSYLLDFYHKTPDKKAFFSKADFFDKLAGTDQLRKQIMEGWTEEEIKNSWKADLEEYKLMRSQYTIYPD